MFLPEAHFRLRILRLQLFADADSNTNCTNGVPGLDGGSNAEGTRVCCPIGCTNCGGVLCRSRTPDGYDNGTCCVGYIVDNYGDCADIGVAPCVITDGKSINS